VLTNTSGHWGKHQLAYVPFRKRKSNHNLEAAKSRMMEELLHLGTTTERRALQMRQRRLSKRIPLPAMSGIWERSVGFLGESWAIMAIVMVIVSASKVEWPSTIFILSI